MNREEYRAILSRLPIKSPTPEDMAELCPHLTPEEAVKEFTLGSGYVACPPLRVRHGFQVISYQKEWVEEIKEWQGNKQVVTGKKNHPALLDYAYSSRTPKSYTNDQKDGDTFHRNFAMKRAMRFAEDNWGEELTLDTWIDIVTIYIQDPTDLVNDKYHRDYPRTKSVLYFTLNRELNVIINDHSKPSSELFDEAIAEMTTDPLIFGELKGGRGSFTEFNCAHCGAGLLLSSCSGCGNKFRDDHFRCGWYTPLSRKMVTFLRENGQDFKVDPEIAWKEEREDWKKRFKSS